MIDKFNYIWSMCWLVFSVFLICKGPYAFIIPLISIVGLLVMMTEENNSFFG